MELLDNRAANDVDRTYGHDGIATQRPFPQRTSFHLYAPASFRYNGLVTAHILRHTYITRLFEAGLDVKEIQYLAGHSTMDMTLSVYTHYDRKNWEQQTAEKVRRAFCKEAV